MINKITNGDCLVEMAKIPSKSVHLICADLPYGVLKAHWDCQIPLEPLWKEYERIITDTGSIVLFGSQPFTSKLVLSNEKLFKYSWVWNKVRPFGFLDAKIRPMKVHEDILVFSKAGCSNGSNPQMRYNPQGLIYAPKTYKRTKSTILNSEPKQLHVKAEYTGYPNSIILAYPDVNEGHPTQKPTKLLEYLIKTYTNEGDLVLDNCCGSGSALVAARNTKRNFIGIELSKEYCEIAQKRLDSIEPDLFNDLL